MKTWPLLCWVLAITLCISILGEARHKKMKGGKTCCHKKKAHCVPCAESLIPGGGKTCCHKKKVHCIRCPNSLTPGGTPTKLKKLVQKCKLCLKEEPHKIPKPRPPIIPLPGV